MSYKSHHQTQIKDGFKIFDGNKKYENVSSQNFYHFGFDTNQIYLEIIIWKMYFWRQHVELL